MNRTVKQIIVVAGNAVRAVSRCWRNGETGSVGACVPRAAGVAVALLLPAVAHAQQPGESFRDCPHCPEMMVVPAGEFMMGSPDSEAERMEDEGPLHKVTILRPFAVGKYEVTYREYAAFAAPRDEEEMNRLSDRHPIVFVTWHEAKEYVARLSEETGHEYRLLSESEWEYVARAGTRTVYHWGNDFGEGNTNCCGPDILNLPVGSFAANGFGLHDMHGNVMEWVEDCLHRTYDGAPSDGRAWLSSGNCGSRVIRSSSASGHSGTHRAASRTYGSSELWHGGVGFRVARSVSPSQAADASPAVPRRPDHADTPSMPAEVEAGCRELAGGLPGRDACLCTYDEDGSGGNPAGFVSKDGKYSCSAVRWQPAFGDSGYLDRLSAAASEAAGRAVRYLALAVPQAGGRGQGGRATAADSGEAGTDAGGGRPPEGGESVDASPAGPQAGGRGQGGRAAAAGSGEDGTDAGGSGPPEGGESAGGGDWNSGAIKVLQWSLRRCGYSVAIDGIHGPGTKAAMRRFLRDSGMPETDMGLSEFHAKINRVSGEGVPNFSCPGGAAKPSEAADLSGQNLSGAKLSNTDFSNTNLTKSNMEGADLENSNFSGANLAGASLRGANLKGANLAGASLRGANLNGAELAGADLEGSNLTDVVADGAKMVGAKLRGVAAAGASLKDAVLEEADLRDADMRKTIMTGASLKGAAILGMRFAERTGIGLNAMIAAAPAYPAALAGRITKELVDKGLEKLGEAADKVLTVGRDGEGGFRIIDVRKIDRCSRFNAVTGECAE